MQVILLERIAKLGQMGDVVRVRNGYARNFLLPQGKALRATKENAKRFDEQRAQLEARNLERKQEAEAVATKLNGESFVIIRQAGETGQLYGSVTNRDLAEALEAGGFTTSRSQIDLNQPIKRIGLHTVVINLHPEVDAEVQVNVARSEDEAERQARGEDLTQVVDEVEELDEPEESEESEQGELEASEDSAADGESEDGASEVEASVEESGKQD